MSTNEFVNTLTRALQSHFFLVFIKESFFYMSIDHIGILDLGKMQDLENLDDHLAVSPVNQEGLIAVGSMGNAFKLVAIGT